MMPLPATFLRESKFSVHPAVVEAIHQEVVNVLGLGVSRQVLQPMLEQWFKGFAPDEESAQMASYLAAGLLAGGISTVANNGMQCVENVLGLKRYTTGACATAQKTLVRPLMSTAISVGSAALQMLAKPMPTMLHITALGGASIGLGNAALGGCAGGKAQVSALPDPADVQREAMAKMTAGPLAFAVSYLTKPYGNLTSMSCFFMTWYAGSQSVPAIVTKIGASCRSDDDRKAAAGAVGLIGHQDADAHGAVSVNVAASSPAAPFAQPSSELTLANGSPLSSNAPGSLGSPESGGSLATAPGSAVTPLEIPSDPTDQRQPDTHLFLNPDQNVTPETDGTYVDQGPAHLHLSPQKPGSKTD